MTNESEQISVREGEYTCFTVNGEEYGLLTDHVTGTQEAPVIRKVPRSPEFIAGVANIRGRILPVIHTGVRFGTIQADQAGRSRKILMLTQSEGVFYGLLADQITGILRLSKKMIEPVNPLLIKRRPLLFPPWRHLRID